MNETLKALIELVENGKIIALIDSLSGRMIVKSIIYATWDDIQNQLTQEEINLPF